MKIPFKVAQNPTKRSVKVALSFLSCKLKAPFPVDTRLDHDETSGFSASDPGGMHQVLAASENLAIRFDPPLLDLDPILPFVAESERLVTVHNDTDSEIEVTGPCISQTLVAVQASFAL